jgi:hypothetical protein
MSAEHPSWCSPTDCLVTARDRRIHLSRAAAAQSPCGELTVTVQLGQLGDDEDPVITMVATFADYGPGSPAEEYHVRLDADLARAVGWMLLTTGRQAARHQNGDRHR